jgi:Tfp pilus assembly protein PilF
LTAAAREVWFFDSATGEVFEKRAKKSEGAPDPRFAEVLRLVEAGDDDAALEAVREVLMADPSSATAYLLAGRIYLRRGETATAISHLRTAIIWDLDRSLVEPHVLLARIYSERGDRVQALVYVQSALKIEPNNREALSLQKQLGAQQRD